MSTDTTPAATTSSPLQTMADAGVTALWNDSADPKELGTAMSWGAVGATCTPQLALMSCGVALITSQSQSTLPERSSTSLASRSVSTKSEKALRVKCRARMKPTRIRGFCVAGTAGRGRTVVIARLAGLGMPQADRISGSGRPVQDRPDPAGPIVHDGRSGRARGRREDWRGSSPRPRPGGEHVADREAGMDPQDAGQGR